ncbi:hypothetical protein [Modestobacter marinus]|uniref:hypothetical protein n=1 Tax=Modestobacter marinus TaxID=477641 RepID=UPI001C95081F|nr:hypothetical protein [Modestobacter marinus]
MEAAIGVAVQQVHRAWNWISGLRTRWKVALVILYTYLAFIAGSGLAAMTNGGGTPSDAYLDGVIAGGNAWSDAVADYGRSISDVSGQCLHEYNYVLGMFEQTADTQTDFLAGCTVAIEKLNRPADS